MHLQYIFQATTCSHFLFISFCLQLVSKFSIIFSKSNCYNYTKNITYFLYQNIYVLYNIFFIFLFKSNCDFLFKVQFLHLERSNISSSVNHNVKSSPSNFSMLFNIITIYNILFIKLFCSKSQSATLKLIYLFIKKGNRFLLSPFINLF